MSATNFGLSENPRHHAYRAQPDPASGELTVDPSIRLRAKSFGVDISLFYSTAVTTVSPWGEGRSASVHGRVLGDPDVPFVFIERGDFQRFQYDKGATVGTVTSYDTASLNGTTTLSYDSATLEYTEYFVDGSRLIYKKQKSTGDVHELVRVTDAAGYAHTYSYGAGAEVGLLKSIQTPGDRRVTLGYQPGTATSLVNTIEDWSGRIWTMQYDGNDRLTTYTAASGCITKYGYNTFSGNVLLEFVEDPRGYRTSYSYDSNKRVLTMKGGAATYSYSYSTGQTVITQPNGGLVTLGYGSNHLLLTQQAPSGSITSFGYDGSFNQTSVIDPLGNITTSAYNAMNQLTMRQNALGHRTSLQYDSAWRLTTIIDAASGVSKIGYNGSGLVETRTDPLGRVTTQLYSSGLLETIIDPSGYRTTMVRDSWGNVEVEINPLGGRTTMGWDSLNRMVTRQGPDGNVWSFAYDAGDNRTMVQDPLGNRTTTIYDGCLPIAVQNALGHRTTTSYGRFENVLTVTSPLGFVSTMHYNDMGDQTASEDALGYRTSTIYDSSRRAIATQDALGYRTTYTRDAAGRVTTVMNARGFETVSVYDAVGNTLASVDALGNRTSYGYDSLQRQTTMTNALGNSWVTVYDAASQATVQVDPAGHRTTTAYTNSALVSHVMDPLGRVTSYGYHANAPLLQTVTSPMGFVSSYGYDTSMRQVSQSLPSGATATTIYDTRGLTEAMVNPLGNRTSYGYDAAMRNTTETNALGEVKTNTYDNDNRLTKMSYASMAPVSYGYDSRGLVTLVQDQVGTTTNTWDAVGQLTNQALPGSLSMAYGYDPVGNRTTVVDTSGGVFTSTYDNADRLSVTQTPANKVYTSQYDAASQVTTLLLGYGATRKMGYDSRGYLTTMIDSGSSGAISTIVDTWDGAGRKTNQVRDGGMTTYTMDSDDRLTGENRGGNLSTFGYDSDRNMTLLHNHGQNAVTMSHNGFGQVVTSIAGSVVTTNTWDNAGRKTVANVGGTLTTFGWDQENRMVSRSRLTDYNEFVYDEANHLRYVHDPGSEEPDALSYNYLDDNTFTVYSGLFGTRSEQMTPLQGVNVGNDDMDFLLDPLGSVIGKTSSSGVEDLTGYFPYGERFFGARPVSDLWAFVGSLGYRRFDDTLYDVWNRWLETDAGHWKSADALWPDELAYMYVAGMPIMIADKDGLQRAPKTCKVYRCHVNLSRPIGPPDHGFICAGATHSDGRKTQCSGGLQPSGSILGSPGIIDDQTYDCPPDMPDITCTLFVSGNDWETCGFASEICWCLRSFIKHPPEYKAVGFNCLDFQDHVLKCACLSFGHKLKKGSHLSRLCGILLRSR